MGKERKQQNKVTAKRASGRERSAKYRRRHREKYNSYMKGYNQARRAILKQQTKQNEKIQQNTDGENEDMKIDNDMVKGAVSIAKDFMVDENGKPTKAVKYVDKIEKYAPIALQFIQGVIASYKEQQEKAAMIKPPVEQQGPQAPPGWLSSNNFERLARKYNPDGTVSAWWSQGQAFEEGGSNPDVNINYVDPRYRDPAPQPIPTRQPQSQHQHVQANSMEDLNKLARDFGPPKEAPQQSQPSNNVVEKEQQKPEEQNALQEISQVLNADAKKYLDMGINYINALDNEKFKEHLNNIDALVEKAKLFKPLLPVHLREMIVNTPAEELENLFKEACAEKYKIAQDEKQVGKLIKLFLKLKIEL